MAEQTSFCASFNTHSPARTQLVVLLIALVSEVGCLLLSFSNTSQGPITCQRLRQMKYSALL